VMSLPALEAIRKSKPDATIAVLARPWVIELYEGQGFADELIVYDRRAEHSGFAGRERLARSLRAKRFDAAVLFQNAFDAAWIAKRARIPERIGYARDVRGFLLTRSIPTPKDGEIPEHECYYYLELLRRTGWIDRLPEVRQISLCIDAARRTSAEQKLAQAGARRGALRLAVAAGAAYGSAKCWSPARYTAVADRFVDEFGADVILFGASGETEVAQRIAAGMRHTPINLVGRTSIGELPALLSTCQMFIGNDSGAMHVAGAVGVRVVGIFGSSDPSGTSPVTPQFRLVRNPVDCSPCFLRKCPIDHRCMTRISIDDVLAPALPWARGLGGGRIA
jgi:heptosyltransferase II